MSLREAWEAQARNWAAWARTPGHDHFFWRYNLPRFLELVPAPGRLTLDLGCGEGRAGRLLSELGHRVVGFDVSPTLVQLAVTHEQSQAVALADAVALPVRDTTVDLVVAFMSLHDFDDLDGAVREAARVLGPGGRLCVAIVHPLASTGEFVDDSASSAFLVSESYTAPRRLVEPIERDGLALAFESEHRPLEVYMRALEDAGFLIEALREPVPDDDHVRDMPGMARQRRIPNFLHLRAVRP